jgi:two-component system sensor kinase FixL
LQESSEDLLEGLDISGLLQELRMIITSIFEDSPAAIEWEIADLLPPVRASRSGLLQVFLNLGQNSVHSIEAQADGRLRIIAYSLPDSVVIRFSDNGPGISSAERLFQPFQAGASSTGMGLFVSRAIIRTFGGELHHTQRPGECSFIIELPALATAEAFAGE